MTTNNNSSSGSGSNADSDSQAESKASGNSAASQVIEDPDCPQEVKDAYVKGQRDNG